MRYRRHYTVAEAEGLIPLVTQWLSELRMVRQALQRQDERLQELVHDFGDQGGERVTEWLRNQARLRELTGEFARRELQVEDLDRGCIGFPALHGGREVLLSWEEGDERIEFWHALDPGTPL
jgi:hypothetical protein